MLALLELTQAEGRDEPTSKRGRGRGTVARKAATPKASIPADKGPITPRMQQIMDIYGILATSSASTQPRSASDSARHARDQRALQTMRGKVDDATQKFEEMEKRLKLMVWQYPGLAKELGLRTSRSFGEDRAASTEKLALAAHSKNGTTHIAQLRAARIMAMVFLSTQRSALTRILLSPPEASGTVMLVWQHDETKQRLQMPKRSELTGAVRSSHMQTSIDVMVGSGSVRYWASSGDTMLIEPAFARSLEMRGKNAQFLVAGLKMMWPIEIMNKEVLGLLAGAQSMVLLGFGCDRAAANFAAFRVIWSFVYNHSPINVLPFAEPCGCHGVCLAKNRAPGFQATSNTLSGFSKLTRQGDNITSIQAAVYDFVYRTARVINVEKTPEDILMRRMVIRAPGS